MNTESIWNKTHLSCLILKRILYVSTWLFRNFTHFHGENFVGTNSLELIDDKNNLQSRT